MSVKFYNIARPLWRLKTVAGLENQSWDALLTRMSLIIKSGNVVMETEVLGDLIVLQIDHRAENEGGVLDNLGAKSGVYVPEQTNTLFGPVVGVRGRVMKQRSKAFAEDLAIIMDCRVSKHWNPVLRASGNLLQHRRHVHSLGVLDDLVLDGVAHLRIRALILVLGEIGTRHLEDEHFPFINSRPHVRTIADLLTTGGM